MDPLQVSHIALWIVVILLSVVVFALMRQIGVLHERVFPAGALMTAAGPKVGDTAPETTLQTFAGNPLTIGSAGKTGISTLLLFTSPSCPVCKTLIPVVKSVQQHESKSRPLQVIFASDGEASDEKEAHRAFLDEHQLDPSGYVISKELGLSYLVEKLPFAVLLDADGIIRAKGIVNSREHLESLFEAYEKGVASLQEYLTND